MTDDYDPNNVFAKILRGDITPQIVYEDDHVLAFKDIQPKRRVHVLLIPKSAFSNITQFGEQADEADLVGLMRAIPKVAEIMGLKNDGYRLISNCGKNGGQEVPHLHFHILGGEEIGPMVN